MNSLTIDKLLALNKILDEADVPTEGRIMRCTGRQLNHLRLSQGLWPEPVLDDDVVEVRDGEFTVLEDCEDV